MTERGAQHGDAATEILGNALRLYSDAKLLFENGRFASCASLSVLAIEELAKFMGMIGAQPLPVRSWRSHADKQVGSASFLLRKRYQAALREVLEETGAADPDADYRRLADMEYRDDEMALFESVLARIVLTGRSVGSREPTLRNRSGQAARVLRRPRRPGAGPVNAIAGHFRADEGSSQFRSRRARDAALDLAHLDGVAKMRLHSVSSCNPTSASCGGNNRCTGSRVQGAGRP